MWNYGQSDFYFEFHLKCVPKMHVEKWALLGNALLLRLLVRMELRREHPELHGRDQDFGAEWAKIERLRHSLQLAGVLHPAIDGPILGTRELTAERAAILALAESHDAVARLRLADVPDQVRHYEGLLDDYLPITPLEVAARIVRLVDHDPGIFGWLLGMAVAHLDGQDLDAVLAPPELAEAAPARLTLADRAALVVRRVVAALGPEERIERDELVAELRALKLGKAQATNIWTAEGRAAWRIPGRPASGAVVPLGEAAARLGTASLAELVDAERSGEAAQDAPDVFTAEERAASAADWGTDRNPGWPAAEKAEVARSDPQSLPAIWARLSDLNTSAQDRPPAPSLPEPVLPNPEGPTRRRLAVPPAPPSRPGKAR